MRNRHITLGGGECFCHRVKLCLFFFALANVLGLSCRQAVAAAQATRLQQPSAPDDVPPVTGLTISALGRNAVLSWIMPSGNVTGYELWRGVTPYFSPGDPYSRIIASSSSTTCAANAEAITCTDAGILGDPAVDRFYLVRVLGHDGAVSPPSGRVGELDYGLQRDGPQIMPTGSLTVVTPPFDCSGQQCWGVRIQCPQLIDTLDATVKVGEPAVQPTLGTIVFFSGWTGTSFLDEWGAEAQRMLADLRGAGYRTVQVRWGATWFQSASVEAAGFQRLACRAATVTQWVSQNWQQPDPELPFCSYGHSNGATEVALMLTRYGVDTILAAAMLDGGPNFARLDAACVQDDPQYSVFWYPESERSLVDWSFGYSSSGPCYQKDATWLPQFSEASASLGDWQYIYPQTNVHFVFGELDQTLTRVHGEHHYQTLADFQTPHLLRTVVPGAPHSTFTVPAGADAVRDALIADCQLPQGSGQP